MGQAGGSGSSASGQSITGAALGAFSTMLQAQGESEADKYQAQRLERAAQYGDLKATQTSAQMTRDLTTTLGNIEAVRAAARADPTSPTGAAYLDNQESIGENRRSIAVGSLMAQANQERQDADFYRRASSNALLIGGVKAAAGLFK
jgi:hypothetical protein